MNLKWRTTLVCVCLLLTGSWALATTPVTVFPNPIQFGPVPLNSTSAPVFIYVSNSGTSAVSISSMSISGTNSGNFAFSGPPCVATISGGQTCQMEMIFTPTAMANATATLVITETGLTSTINIPLQGTGGNPFPNVTSLSPPGLYVNSPSTTISINGLGFISSTAAYLQNSSTPLPTTFVSSTQIKVQIPDTALANIGQIYMYVVNPAPAGGSAYLTLPVIALVPTVGNITPTSIVAGTASEPIIINGQNFMSGATVKWNGRSVATTYLSPTQLQAQPTTGELAAAGLIQLTVTNPPPGTISPPFNFDVTYPITVT